MQQVTTKKEFAVRLGVSPSTLRRWLNEIYYEQLAALGYQRSDRILKPQVVQWLCTHLVVECG